MGRILIQDNTRLAGEVSVRGSKSAVPDLLIASMLGTGTTVISNASFAGDVGLTLDLLRACGCSITTEERRGRIHIHGASPLAPDPQLFADLHARSRKPILACAPLLARVGAATISASGGCKIGPRPVDMHLGVLTALGATVTHTRDRIAVVLPRGRFRGAKVALRYPSVGATEQFLLAAATAEGDSELSNAATEPEVINVVRMLRRMGAGIVRPAERIFRVTGVPTLSGASIRAVPDRLEAASWASLALATDSRITVRGINPRDLATFVTYFRRAGGGYSASGTEATFWRAEDRLQPLSIETDVHPGFMTDWQPPFMTALTQARGRSILHETVFEDRLAYADALRAMGAQVETSSECLGNGACRFAGKNHRHSAVVVGSTPLHGAELCVPDLRAGFAFLVAALTADGPSVISGTHLIERGYELIWEKLAALGARVREY